MSITGRTPWAARALVCWLILSALFLAIPASSSAQSAFRAGAHVVDVSPETFPIIINGGFIEQTASKLTDPLFARAIVLDDGSTRIAFCVVDLCVMPRELIDQAKQLASTATGLPLDHILVSAIHTHSAPSVMGCLGSRANEGYAAALPAKIAKAITGALRNLAPARVGWITVDDWDHTFNRRWIRRPDRMVTDPFGDRTGRAHMHPGYESPDVIGPSGPVDPGLSLLALQTPEGRPLAVLANYSQHYYGSPPVSSDYAGRFTQHLAKLLGAEASSPSFVGVFSQGTSGDLMYMDYGSPRHDIGYDAYARELAERAAAAYKQIAWHDSVPLGMSERKLQLRYRVPDEKRLAWARQLLATMQGRLPRTIPEVYAGEAVALHEKQQTELVLQAIRIGDLGITALPNEVFALTGLKLKAQSPLVPTFNIELANGEEGYIPPPEQHALGGYTTWPARTAGLEIQAEPRIVETLLGMLEELAGKPRRPVVVENGPYAQAILAAKPVAYWRLDEMAIPTAHDITGSGHDGTYEPGIALFLPGASNGIGRLPDPKLVPSNFSGLQINRAVHFAGGRLKAPLPQLGERYSVELWLWNGLPADARPMTGVVFSRGQDGGSAALGDHLGISGTARPGQAGCLLVTNGAGSFPALVGKTPINLHRWYHVVFVRDAGHVAVYLDGQPELSGELNVTRSSSDTTCFLGGRCDNVANFEGRLDEVAIFDRALSLEEAAAHYQASGLAPR